MEKKKVKRGAKLPGVSRPLGRRLTPAVTHEPDANDLLEAALSSGPQHLLRDIEAQRHAHILAKQEASETTFHAFQALCICVIAALRETGNKRIAAGQPLIADFATEASHLTFRVPAWAADAIFEGWMKAAHSNPDEDGTDHPPLPLMEALQLGGTANSRTVALKHRNRSRDLRIAVEVAEARMQEPPVSENIAVMATLDRYRVSKTVAYDAWKRHENLARAIVAQARALSSRKSDS